MGIVVVVVAWPTIVERNPDESLLLLCRRRRLLRRVVWKKEGQRVVVVWSANKNVSKSRCAFRARARPTGIITTREKCQKRGREKMVKKKRDFFFKFFHLGF